jgi:hypothetical protein
MKPSGIKPATFRFVAHLFNRYVTFTSKYLVVFSEQKTQMFSLTTSRVVFSTSLGTLLWALTYMTYKASVSLTYVLTYSMQQSLS